MGVNRKIRKYNVEETETDKLKEIKNQIRKKVGKPYLKISPKTENQEKFIILIHLILIIYLKLLEQVFLFPKIKY